jgi:hypothetical protein
MCERIASLTNENALACDCPAWPEIEPHQAGQQTAALAGSELR